MQGEAGGVGAVLGSEFLHDARDMQLNRIVADVEFAPDNLVGTALHQLLDHLDFPRGEIRTLATSTFPRQAGDSLKMPSNTLDDNPSGKARYPAFKGG